MKPEVGTIYHCETEKDAKYLLSKLHELGYEWITGNSLLEDNYWNIYEYKTCYRIREDKKITRASKHTYVYMIGDNELDGEIIKYEKGFRLEE